MKTPPSIWRHLAAAACLLLVPVTRAPAADPSPANTDAAGVESSARVFERMLTERRDVWTETAIAQPNGPSYEFFAALLPPLRYVEAPFRVYPIPLSAPGAPVKARFIADGRGLNWLARQPNWRGEMGTPVTFRVGPDRATFGEDPRRLEGPKYAEGYLPIVQTRYRHAGSIYAQECFADVHPGSAEHGVALARFALAEGERGRVEVQFESAAPLKRDRAALRNGEGKVIACFDRRWEFNLSRNTLTATLEKGEPAVLAVFTAPADAPLDPPLDAASYDARRAHCATTWKTLLARGMTLDLPETVVNNAWRAALIGSYSLLTGDEIRYSHGNQYAKLYIGEGGDAARSFMLFGHLPEAGRMIRPLFVYTRKNLEFHQAAFKLQMLAHYHQLTRDARFLEEHRPLWQKEIDVILNGREKHTGMLPREKYCGDIDTMVYSLNSNSNCWRALRDMSILLERTGDRARAAQLAETAGEYRRAILASLDHAVQRDAQPPFVPIALSGEEKAYEFIPETRMGGYWNIMIQYVLGSGVFRSDSPVADDLLRYLQQRGGLVMGLLSTHAESTRYWMADRKINDLYGMRYALTLLQRDEPDRALASFYAKLAQGFTRDTFICAEGSDIAPLDEFGRLMYLPPNSAGNASFLQQLRGLLVQDLDLDDDGRPETLRLLFATPRPWLADGQRIRIERAPTAFGEIAANIESKLNDGRILAEITLPTPAPGKTLLRLRLPVGWRIASAQANARDLPMTNPETLDLSGLSGGVKVQAFVEKTPR